MMMALDVRTPRTVLVVRFPTSWDHIDPLRHYVMLCAKACSAGVAERVGIVLQELLENAVKYGDPTSEVELSVDLDPANPQRGVELRVSNHAHRSRLAVLEKEHERIGATTPQNAFAKALERLKRLPQGSSMLGLSRIATESTIKMEVFTDRVVICARVL